MPDEFEGSAAVSPPWPAPPVYRVLAPPTLGRKPMKQGRDGSPLSPDAVPRPISAADRSDWPPEAVALVADVAAALGRPGIRSRPTIQTDPASWREYLELADRHAVLAVIHPVVEKNLSGLPQELLDEVRARVKRRVGLSYLLAAKLVRLMALLTGAGLSPVPFKGPVLAAKLHGDVGLRSFTDLDLFVPEEQLSRAVELLADQGFVVDDSAEWRRLERTGAAYHCNLISTSGSLSVELHWRLTPRHFAADLNPGEWLRRLDKVEVSGRLLPCFSSEDTLLQLCVHGGKHLWGRLGWIVDVALTVERSRIDWPLLLERARSCGCERHLLLGLELAGQLLAAELPVEVRQRIGSDQAVTELARVAIGHLFAPQGADRSTSVPRFYWLLQSRTRDRLRLLAYLLREKIPARVPLSPDRARRPGPD